VSILGVAFSAFLAGLTVGIVLSVLFYQAGHPRPKELDPPWGPDHPSYDEMGQ
jgi:hypothetical protein